MKYYSEEVLKHWLPSLKWLVSMEERYPDEVIKVQPRVIALEEIQMREVYWAERKNVTQPWPIAMHHIRNVGPLNEPVYQDYMGDDFNIKEYGKTWRCWTSYPTEEQQKAAPWSEQNQREYEVAVEMAEYCEHYEPTYNIDDGSM